MHKLKGIPVSPGVAIGKIVEKKERIYKIEKQNIHENHKESEVKLLFEALASVMIEIDELIFGLQEDCEDRQILITHKLILEDKGLRKSITNLITSKSITKEHAVYLHFRSIIEHFENIKNDIFAQKAMDYQDVAHRLLSNLLGEDRNFVIGLDSESILFTNEISPSNVSSIGRIPIKAFCSEKGSITSHSSIIARAMQLPAIVNVAGLLKNNIPGAPAIIDGYEGIIIIDPDIDTIKRYEKLITDDIAYTKQLQLLTSEDAITKDGHRIFLHNNIEFPNEVEKVVKNGSDGIGLFRSEFLYLESKDLPSELDQIEVYQQIAEKIYPNEVIIRTIDIGGDKLSDTLSIGEMHDEANPYLGCRGIRLSLKYPNILKTQLQAMLRANVKGNIKIMFPMISDVFEVIRAKVILEECKIYLLKKGIQFNDNIKIGAMIEIPSAAICSNILTKECDFVSIGTNDLVQYTLAVDRNSEILSDYYNSYHPSIFRLIEMTIKSAKNAKIPVAICGEMASNLDFVPVFIGLGIDELSVNPVTHLRILQKIRTYNHIKTQELAQNILQLSSSAEILKTIKEWRKTNEN